MILVHGSVVVRDGLVDDAIRLSLEHVHRSRAFVAELAAMATEPPGMTTYSA